MNRRNTLKRHSDRAVRTTISLAPEIHREVEMLILRLKIGGLSEYITLHVRQDAGLNKFLEPEDK